MGANMAQWIGTIALGLLCELGIIVFAFCIIDKIKEAYLAVIKARGDEQVRILEVQANIKDGDDNLQVEHDEDAQEEVYTRHCKGKQHDCSIS